MAEQIRGETSPECSEGMSGAGFWEAGMKVIRFDHILERGGVKLSSLRRTTFGRIGFVALSVVARRTLVAVKYYAENFLWIQAFNRFIDQVSWSSTGADDD